MWRIYLYIDTDLQVLLLFLHCGTVSNTRNIFNSPVNNLYNIELESRDRRKSYHFIKAIDLHQIKIN